MTPRSEVPPFSQNPTKGPSGQRHRLTGPSYAYDASGNLTLADGVTYTYDPMHLTTTRNGDGTEWAAIYTADDERLAVWDTAQGTVQETWTLRGLDGLVLREYFFGVGLGGELIFADGFESGDLCAWTQLDGTPPDCPGTGPGNPTWSVRGTYVYRNGALLADVSDASIRHYHLDHLGSVRQITDDEGVVAETHDYLPYGTEVPGSSSGLRFTGHERDGHLAGGGDDLDYMHARYYSPGLGRFLSVDPVPPMTRARRAPQNWNLYSYVSGNPIVFIDSTGLALEFATQKILDAFLEGLRRAGAARFADALSNQKSLKFSEAPVGFADAKNADVRHSIQLIQTATTHRFEINFSLEQAASTTAFDNGDTLTLINPDLVSSTYVPAVMLSGQFAGSQVGAPETLDRAIFHEFGHAAGKIEGFPLGARDLYTRLQNDAIAVKYENAHGALISGPGNYLRMGHHFIGEDN